MCLQNVLCKSVYRQAPEAKLHSWVSGLWERRPCDLQHNVSSQCQWSQVENVCADHRETQCCDHPDRQTESLWERNFLRNIIGSYALTTSEAMPKSLHVLIANNNISQVYFYSVALGTNLHCCKATVQKICWKQIDSKYIKNVK